MKQVAATAHLLASGSETAMVIPVASSMNYEMTSVALSNLLLSTIFGLQFPLLLDSTTNFHFD